MRYLVTLLLLAVPVLGVWTFMDAANHQWWFPERASSFAKDIDDLFDWIMYMVGFVFVITEIALVWFVFNYSKKRSDKGVFTHGNHKLEMVWTAIPAIALLGIAFLQMGTWADIKFEKNLPNKGRFTNEHPIADLWASQFDWRVRYPGADGVLGTADDIENSYEFIVPVDEPIVFHLRSRDVIHSFFVPQFRLKQDALPGHTIPVWFKAEKTGIYDLVCAELCGWGHYKMAGRVRVVSKAEYEERMAAMTKHWFDNGSEDAK
jgi:cytochrome c oxidase subunit 2